jgi:hypothetical protein
VLARREALHRRVVPGYGSGCAGGLRVQFAGGAPGVHRRTRPGTGSCKEPSATPTRKLPTTSTDSTTRHARLLPCTPPANMSFCYIDVGTWENWRKPVLNR